MERHLLGEAGSPCCEAIALPTQDDPISAPSAARRASVAQVAWVPLLLVALSTTALGSCGRRSFAGDSSSVVDRSGRSELGDSETRRASTSDPNDDEEAAAAYEGVDSRGIPHYAATRAFSPEEVDVLRRAYGIVEPHRLYVSDSTEEGILKYDTQPKRCLTCYVNSYRVGYVSVRRAGESWEDAERRVRTTPARVFTGSPFPASRSLEDLDPDVQPLVAQMLRDARAAAFQLRVTATYRSPVREAFLMAEGAGRTHTLTSNHSYGRAIDVLVDDGNWRHAPTKRDWIAFRRWVTQYRTPAGESFRILGQVDRTWDWGHVELPSSQQAFRTIEDAVVRGRACLAEGATIPCNFPPHLPARLREISVQ